MKQICRNCHFLAKEHRIDNGQVFEFSLSQDERKKMLETPEYAIADYYSLKCCMGVWDEGILNSEKERHLIINLTKRNSSCFFFSHNPAMLFDAARELQRRAAENTQLKRSNFYTRLSLWIASAALFLNVIIEFLKNI